MDYANGKIYMIEPTCEYAEGDVYYGSTATTLVKRFWSHRSSSSNTTRSKILIEKYGRDNIKIVLLEEFPCESKSQLKALEAKYIRENKCVNKYIPGQTRQEYKKTKRDKLAEQQRDYVKANRDKINARARARYAEKKSAVIV